MTTLSENRFERLNRDLDQIGQWLEEYHRDLPDNFKQSLRVDGAYKEMMESLKDLKNHLKESKNP